MIVAIDGPAGSGKSTVSRLLAKKLGFIYLDTGAMYRALTLKVIRERADVNDDKRLSAMAAALDFRFDGNKVFLDGKDVSEAIRTPEVEKTISAVCKIPAVREHLVALQRKIASKNSCVTEGRDTCTVVFPHSELKVFLDASPDERARRRLQDFKAKGIAADQESVKADLVKRDDADYSRVVGPLKKAVDAVVLDTTGLSIAQVVDKIYELAKAKMEK